MWFTTFLPRAYDWAMRAAFRRSRPLATSPESSIPSCETVTFRCPWLKSGSLSSASCIWLCNAESCELILLGLGARGAAAPADPGVGSSRAGVVAGDAAGVAVCLANPGSTCCAGDNANPKSTSHNAGPITVFSRPWQQQQGCSERPHLSSPWCATLLPVAPSASSNRG